MKEVNDGRLSANKERIPKLPLDIAIGVTKRQQLKHVEINEKSILPTALDLYREKVDENLKGEIRTHDTNKLHHAKISERNILPRSGDIAREKVPTLIVNFNVEKLRHVEPLIKLALPSADDAIRDKEKSKLK